MFVYFWQHNLQVIEGSISRAFTSLTLLEVLCKAFIFRGYLKYVRFIFNLLLELSFLEPFMSYFYIR